MAINYVDDFEFPPEAGFTGSAGAQSVRGYQRGGKVGHRYNKESPQFRMKTGKMDPMDHGVQPARRGRNQAEIEAGGTKRLLPGFKHGGQANAEMYKHGGKMGFKKGVQHKYALGGLTHGDPAGRNRPNDPEPTSQGEQVKATGQHAGKKRLAGQNRANQRRNTVRGAAKSQGESVQAVGRGKVNVGKGGKTGAHRGFKYAEGGQVLSGQSRDDQRRNTVEGTHPGEGQDVQPVGRGTTNVGGGGTVGSHRGFKYAKGGRVLPHSSPYKHGGGVRDTYRTDDPGGYKDAMRNRGKGVASGK